MRPAGRGVRNRVWEKRKVLIAQGRFDVVTPISGAWALHRAWPEAKLDIVKDAGHASTEPGIIDSLVRATDWAAGI